MSSPTQIETERLFLHAMLESSPDYLYFKDTEGRFLRINRALAAYFGLNDPAEAIGKTDFDFYPEAKAREQWQDELCIMQTGRPVTDKLERHVRPGGVVWLLSSKAVLCDREGRVVGTFGMSRDITGEKRAQQALQTVNADLLRSRGELVQALEELRSVQLQLVEAEKMKLVGRLAAGVAHEVKNPLAIITMGLEYLNSRTFEDPNIRTILSEIGSAVERADGVIRELLDFSAPKKLNLEPQEINRLIRHALVLVRGELGGHHIKLVEELDERLPPVRLDATKIEQVLVNLFTNAAYAMENGGTLTVRTSLRQVTGMGENINPNDNFRLGAHLVAVDVCDTGPGIPESMLGKIFEPFFTTKPTGQGTGLGLTVTKTIIDLHGGSIEIRNRPEGGACASVLFKAETD
jgi:PAS domain S-box-containing protein